VLDVKLLLTESTGEAIWCDLEEVIVEGSRSRGRKDGGRVWTAGGKEGESSGEATCCSREEGSVKISRKAEGRVGSSCAPPEQECPRG
jgi:hypothetical protein